MFIIFAERKQYYAKTGKTSKNGKTSGVKGFRPHGAKSVQAAVEMLYEEYEALKLADYDGYSQVEAAEKMDVSRPTFTRIYDKALKKIARAFVEHREIIIKGGQVTFDENWFRCNSCHYIFKMPGKGNNISHCPVCGSQDIIDETAGNRKAEKSSEAWCVCVECRNKVKHEPGIPCRKMECPECNGRMKRLNG
ncbi:MAG: DUF134 domain-containing protein [Bacteroidales bacterium]|nr:DUF134 domain-containing protein [Bacteroidales bacterium]